MQTLQHTMAHRGAGATRTNARWHPYTPPRPSGVLASCASTPNYAALLSSVSQHPTSVEHNYLITPASTVYSVSPSSTSFSQSPHASTSGLHQAALQVPKQIPVPKAHPAKANYVASLVDQAVKSLTDIWHPECIPPVFVTSTQISVANAPSTLSQHPAIRRQYVHLPSPCSPSTQHSPLPPADPPRASVFLGEHFINATVVAEKDLVPIKTFVHEVLRRSRTTCSVLQSALCYIEAVRKRVPILVEEERHGLGVRGEPELGERIVKEDDEAQSSPTMSNLLSDMSTLNGLPTEPMPTDLFDGHARTVLQADATLPSCDALEQTQHSDSEVKRRKPPAKPLTPLPPLPSPLLCPRRTFLAALILASKFLQDRCYSNRAWAKLSGLPPREVGRCERALGDALEWRLWVGKGTSVPKDGSRAIMRTKSESIIALSSSARSQSHIPSPPLSDSGASPETGRVLPTLQPTRASDRSLRRAATLPDEAAFRSVPPRYRSPGSLPFSFVGPSLAVIAAHQSAALSAQQILLSSAFTSQALSSSATMSMVPEEPTPRLSYSPLSLVEPNLDTPNYNASWSPAHSTSSTDSSESSSSGSSVATPPDVPNVFAPGAVRFSSRYVAASRASMLGSEYRKASAVGGEEVLKQYPFAAAAAPATDVTDPASWYAQVLSSGGTFGNIQLSMPDSLGSDLRNTVGGS